ncbi:MAG: hypothetical protein AB1746_03230 [Candidatus Zixiibacteriota bacterium]
MKPILKIVKLTDIMPLMESDPAKVDYLKRIIKSSESIRHPLALAALSANKYILLEDASILEAAHDLRINYIPAQVIKCRKTLKFEANLTAGNIVLSDIMAFAEIFPRAFYADGNEAAGLMNTVKITISRKDNPGMAVYFFRNKTGHLPPALFTFLNFLRQRWRFCSGLMLGRVRAFNVKCGNDNWLLNIERLSINDLIHAGENAMLFVPGLLKFNYGHRIIGIEYPVDVLKENVPVAQKEQFLHDLVNLRLNSGFSDFIRNGVYLLNY